MDEEIIRTQTRPYYDSETFDAGYSAVFRPDKGVIDPYGFNIASKLQIVQSNNKGLVDLKAVERKAGFFSFLSRWFTGSSRENKGISGDLISNRSKLLSDSDQNINKSLDSLEWSDMLDIEFGKKLLSQLFEELAKIYVRHLVQQPFEVSRVLLQVGDFTDILAENAENTKDKPFSERPAIILEDQELNEDNERDEEIEFFPKSSKSPELEQLHQRNLLINPIDINDVVFENRIRPESLHVMDIISSLVEKEGIRGVWRANNTTFIYNFLSMTCNVWFIGLLSPFFGISDPNFLDSMLSTTTSLSSLDDIKISIGLSICSTVMTNILLIPLDLIKMKLITTSIAPFALENNVESKSHDIEIIEFGVSQNEKTRSLRGIIKNWSWKKDLLNLPVDMWFLTVLNSLLSINRSSSIFFGEKLFTLVWVKYLGLTKEPTKLKLYNLSFCCFQTLGIFFKLPIETMLHRCQVNYLLNRAKEKDDKVGILKNELIIKPIIYDSSILLYNRKNKSIPNAEETTIASKKIKALWNGWRISVVSLLCDYGLKVLQKNDKSIEFEF